VLGLIITTHFLINRSLGNSIVSLEFFYFSSKEILLAFLSLSLSSLALNQKLSILLTLQLLYSVIYFIVI
jgi:hypothetical protein